MSLAVSGLECTLQSNDCGDGGVRAVDGALYHRRELRNLDGVVGENLRLEVRLGIRVVVRLFLGIVVAFGVVFLGIGVFLVVVVLLVVLVVAPADLGIALALAPFGSVL